MNFSYDIEDDVLRIAAYNADIKLFMHNGEVESILVNDEHEYVPTDDGLFGHFVMVGPALNAQFHCLHSIMLEANKQYDAIRDEAEAELEDDLAMRKELSSPYLTGRI